eukprot:282653_1
MGCSNGKSDVDDLEDGTLEHAQSIGGGESWHDNLSLEEKKKIAKLHGGSECFFCKCCGIFGAWTGLKCCCCHFTAETPFLSIKHDRHCTDIPCCCLMIAAIALQLLLVLYAITTLQADPRWLVYYSDIYGQLCAPSISLEEYDIAFNVSSAGNYAAWPDIRMYDLRVCVDHCNDTLTDDRIVTPSFDADLGAIEFDSENGLSIDLSGYQSVNVLEAICIPDPEYADAIASHVLDADYSDFADNFNAVSDQVSLAVADVKTCVLLFILCAITAALISMFWGFLIRQIGAIIIWVSILITLVGVGLLAYYLITYSQYAYLFGYTTIGDVMYYTGVGLAVCDIGFALAVCAMWNRIRLAIAIAKETTRALSDMWSLFFYPLLPFLAFMVYIAYWIVGGVYMSSVTVEKEWPMPLAYTMPYYEGGPTLQSKLNLPDDATYVYLEVDDNWQYLGLFHFFVLLWVTHFISYHTFMVIAGVYAEWYFADWKDESETQKWRGSDEELLVIDGAAVRNDDDLEKSKAKVKENKDAAMKENKDAALDAAGQVESVEEIQYIAKLSRTPVCGSFGRVTKYHLGTIAFASLLIAIIEFIEYTLTYFEKKFVGAEPSPMKKIIIAIIHCALKVMKCILDRINRNGLIVTSIYGWPFCAASMKGIALVFKNVVRSSALAMVSGYLEKLGKICIIAGNLGLCMMFANYYYGNTLSSLVLPMIICFGITFVVTWQYMHLYEVGISTIFICFLVDEERNKSFESMKASKRLRKIIGAHKPPKEYLIAHSRSIRHDGVMDQTQKLHFANEAKHNEEDLRTMETMGHVEYFSDEEKKELNRILTVDQDDDEHDKDQVKHTFTLQALEMEAR